MIQDEIIELTKKLVSFKSTIENPEEILRCAEFIEEYFEEEDVFVKTFVQNNVPSIFISLHEKQDPTIMLSSHFDVVPGEEELFDARIEGDHLIGRGTYDDKGPLAIQMALIKELSKREDKPDIALLTTGDEETGGEDGAQYVLEQGITSKFAIVMDGGGLNKYSTKAKGAIQVTLSAKGKDAHGSRPWQGENAIVKLMDAYEAISDFFPDTKDEWRKTINAGTIRGGEAVNKVAASARMELDIRFTENDDPDLIISQIESVAHNKDIEAEIEYFIPVFFTDQTSEHFQHLMQLSGHLFDEDPEVIRDYGASDARFFHKHNIPSVLTCPGGGFHHSKHEYMDVTSIPKIYELLKQFALDIGSPYNKKD